MFCLLFANNITNIWSECPKPEIINPCVCKDEIIYCGGNESINLKIIFNHLSQESTDEKKHFKQFHLNNTAITELQEIAFSDITFDEIVIENATNLTLINTNALTETNLITKTVDIQNTPIINSPPNHDIYHVLSLLKNIEYINIVGTQITEIPSYAFKPLNGYQYKLKTAAIWLSPITKLGEYAYYYLDSVNHITVSRSLIDYIPSHAFELRQESKEKIDIFLDNNHKLNGSSFGTDAFLNIRRPAIIHLWMDSPVDELKFLDEKVFYPFLSASANSLELSNNTIDCNDCRNYWLNKDLKLTQRIRELNCTNGKSFTDNSNFQKCVQL